MNQKLYANIVDILNQTIFPGCIEINEGRIVDLYPVDATYDTYLLCGFIDAHIHIESSMMPPSEFARIALTHGTIAAVTDPHEIVNVMGIEGVDFMIKSGQKVPFYFSNGLPSCVPATDFETAGAKIGIPESHCMIQRKEITHLSEVMNVPAVLNHEPEILQKINLAQIYHKPVDGHAPLLQGKDLITYIQSGITTDHEAISYAEAKEKIEEGMKIQIREGSSAKNFEALYPLIDEYPDSCMFCSDDLHPDDLIHGHINRLVKRAIDKRLSLWNVLQCAAINPRIHYNLESGMLRIGDTADFIEVDNLTDWTILNTYIQGKLVSSNQKPLIPYQPEIPANAIYPILVMVGVLIFTELSHIRLNDISIAIPTFFIVVMMPLTYSITNGLAFGFISYLVIKLLKKEFNDINIGIVLLAGISLLALIF